MDRTPTAPALDLEAGALAALPPDEAGPARPLPWVRLGPSRRYFETEDGAPFLIIGQNDALTWPELEGLLGRRDLPGVDRHLAWLKAHGITTLRLMLEYVGDGLFLERDRLAQVAQASGSRLEVALLVGEDASRLLHLRGGRGRLPNAAHLIELRHVALVQVAVLAHPLLEVA
jgi:hypothetical protein